MFTTSTIKSTFREPRTDRELGRAAWDAPQRRSAAKSRIAGPLLLGGAVLGLPLLAIGGWYAASIKATQAELDRAVAVYEKIKERVAATFIVAVPDNTPRDQVLYVSGSVPALGNWNAAGVPLTRGDDGRYRATVPDLLNGLGYEFKVTRGTCDTVETGANGGEIPAHTFTANRDARIDVTVVGWRDNGKIVPRPVAVSDIRVVMQLAEKDRP